MTSVAATKKMMEEATCPVCLELMMEPMSINCGHSFCLHCIAEILDNQQVTSPPRSTHCPLCREPFQRESLRPNKQLKNLIQTVKEIDCERLCEEHGEKLLLFCEDDGQLICWRCERSPKHKGHSTTLVEDAVPDYKAKLQKAGTDLRSLETRCQHLKLAMQAKVKIWEEKIELQRQQLQSDFKNLYRFLHEEEKSFLWRLENEKEMTLKSLQDGEASLEQQNLEIKRQIVELEKKCQGSAQDVLHDVQATLNRMSTMKLKVPEAFPLETYSVCNISELYFNVKKILKSYQGERLPHLQEHIPLTEHLSVAVTVTLDPDTAHEDLSVSEDRRQVSRGGPQVKPQTSGRFSVFRCVLGCEAFTIGRYYFEVYVGEDSGCDLGVCLENVPRGNYVRLKPQSGFWAIRVCKLNGSMALTSPPTPLPLSEQLQVVGVYLDCEAGLVSFYNMKTGSHVFTFPKASFSETLRPFFRVWQRSPLFLPSPHK